MFDHNIWFHIVQYVTFMSIIAYSLLTVFKNQLRFSIKTSSLLVISYVVIVGACVVLCMTEVSPYTKHVEMAAIIIILVSVIMGLLVFKCNILHIIFIVFVFYNTQYSTTALAKSLYNIYQIPMIFEYEHANFLMLTVLIFILLLPFIYYLVIHLFGKVVENTKISGNLLLLYLLPIGHWGTLQLLTMREGNNMAFLQKSEIAPFILYNICAYLSYVAVLQAMDKTRYSIQIEKENHFINQQLLMQQEQYKNLREKIKSDAQTRHDWRHHLITVMGYIEKDNFQGLKNYLGEYNEKYLRADEELVCDVQSLEMLFNHYIRIAKSKGIKVKITTALLKDCKVSESDLTIIFGNLFENAIEACERQQNGEKFIDIKIKNQRNHVIAIIVSNSFDGNVKKEKDKFVSSKREHESIGLTSVENVAKKNGGSCEIEIIDCVFKVYVALIV